jgi:TldD protein
MEYLVDLAEKILNEALNRGAQDAIVRVQEKVYESIVFDNGILRVCSISRVSGLGLTVFVGGSVGYSYASIVDRDSIPKIVDEAISVAKALEYGSEKRLVGEEVKGARGSYRTEFKINPFDVDLETKVKLINNLNNESMKKEGIVSAFTRYGCEIDRKYIVSSFCSKVQVEVVAIGLSHLAVARYGDIVERVGDQKTFIGGYEFIEKFDWSSFVNEINDLAYRASQASTITPGVYQAVVDNELVGLLLHEAFGHASEGDAVYSDLSVLKGRLGQVVASEKVTIVDDGMVSGGYPVPFDDDGIEKKVTYIVKNGVLAGYLNSIVTAKKLGQIPTGNARAQDITFNTIVRQTNFYMLSEDAKVEELFEGIDYGVYLKGRGAGGGQVNPALGTFTFGVGPSYIIRKGEMGELVRSVIVSGNILEVLKNVDMVANDLNVTTSVFGGCGKMGQMVRVGDGGPHVRVKKLVVGSR